MSVQGNKFGVVVSYVAATVEDLALQFEARASDLERKAASSTGKLPPMARRSANIQAGVWKDAADMLRHTKIEA